MQIQKNLLFAFTIIVFLSSVGCEEKRYKPAAWRSTTLPAADATEGKAATEKAAAAAAGTKTTDWLEMAGKGGENVQPRSNSLPTPVAGGSTLPNRANSGTSLPARGSRGSTLPARGGRGSTLPARGQRYQNSTTLPGRNNNSAGSTLPRRNNSSTGSTLPRR